MIERLTKNIPRGIEIKLVTGPNGTFEENYFVRLSLPLNEFKEKQKLTKDSISLLLDFYIKTANYLEVSVHKLSLIINTENDDLMSKDEIFNYNRLINQDFPNFSASLITSSKNTLLEKKIKYNSVPSSSNMESKESKLGISKSNVRQANFNKSSALSFNSLDNSTIIDSYTLPLSATRVTSNNFNKSYSSFSERFIKSMLKISAKKPSTNYIINYIIYDTNPFRVKVLSKGLISNHWEYFWLTSQSMINTNTISLFNVLEGKFIENDTIFSPNIDDLENGLDLKNKYSEECKSFLKKYKNYLIEKIKK